MPGEWPPEVARAAADPARRLGSLVLVHEVGSGGIGRIWKAWDPRLSRWVAVKRLVDRASGPALLRFQREARIAAGLKHPHVVAVHEFGEHEGRPWLAMELLEGGAFDPRGPLKRSVAILAKVARGLAAAHAQGIVHRDLKPANIMLDARGEPRLVDFGLAHFADAEQRLTRSGTALGTPLYMAPEQVRGDVRKIGPATDVYALGVLLYESLAGRPAFTGASVAAIYDQVLNADPAPPPGPPDLVAVSLKALSKNPRDRYRGADEFAAELERWQAGEPVLAKPPGWTRKLRGKLRWIAAGVLVAAAAAGGAVVLDSSRESGRHRAELEREKAALEAGRLLDERIAPIAALVQQAKSASYIPGDEIYRRHEDLRKARPELEALAAKAPGHAGVRIVLSEALSLLGKAEEAAEVIDQAAVLRPDDPAVHRLRARAHLEMAFRLGFGKGAEARREASRQAAAKARESFAKAVGGWGGATDLDLDVARAYAAFLDERWDEAVRLAREGIARHGDRVGVEEFHRLIGTTSRADEAEKEFGLGLRRKPHSPELRIIRAHVRASVRDWAGLESDLVALLRLWPTADANLAPLAKARLQLGRTREALADAEACVRRLPRHAYGHVVRAEVLFALAKPEDGFESIQRALDLDPRESRAWELLARREQVRGDLEAALAAWRRVVILQPEALDARSGVVKCLERLGRSSEAESETTRWIEAGGAAADCWVLRAQVRLNRQRVEDAVADLDEGERRGCRMPDLWHFRGIAYEQQGRTGAAEEQYGKAISMDDCFEYRMQRGGLRARTGAAAGAREDFEAAARLNPDHPDPWFHQGCLHLEAGRHAEAIPLLERSIQAGGPKWVRHDRAKELLQAAREASGR